jgi:DeoR family transcriptional regulator of aga operon
MISSAARAVVLADSSKFRHPAFCDVCAVTEVQCVITDSGLAEGERQRLVDAGVEVLIAPAG